MRASGTQVGTEFWTKSRPSSHWWIALSLMVLAAGAVARPVSPEAPDTAIRAVKRHLENRDAARDLGRQAAHAASLRARLGEAAAGTMRRITAA